VYRHFSAERGGGIFYWGDFSRGEFSVGRESSGGLTFPGETYTGVIFIQKSFYLSYFLFADSILHLDMLRDIVLGKIFTELEIS